MNECVESVVNWEGFIGGLVFGGLIVFAWLSKKAKDRMTTTYQIDEVKRRG